jgi:hypothetical protein
MINVGIGNCDENLDKVLLVSVVDEFGVFTGEHFHVGSTEMLFHSVSKHKHIVLSEEVPKYLGVKND